MYNQGFGRNLNLLMGQPAGSSSSSSPITTDGLSLWLRADVGVTVTGSGVSLWADQSGNGNDFIQDTDARRPTLETNVVNGLPVVRGVTASQQYLYHSANAIVGGDGIKTIFMVIDPKTDVGSTIFAEGQRNIPFAGDAGRYQQFAPSTRINSVSGFIDWAEMVDNEFHDYIFTQPTAELDSYTMSVDNAANLTSSGSTNTTSVINANSSLFAMMEEDGDDRIGTHATADLAELIIYSRVLSPTEKTSVHGYLAEKYAL